MSAITSADGKELFEDPDYAENEEARDEYLLENCGIDPDAWSGWSPQIRRVETAPEQDPPPQEAAPPAPRRSRPGLRGVVLGPVGVQVPSLKP